MLEDLQNVVSKAVEGKQLPAASVAVLTGGEITTAAAGVLSTKTQVEADPDTLFQIGSTSKLYTATLIMQLVDEGKASLDAPVRTYLPDFKVADAEASEQITVRHLLTHTSGFDGGDHFVDTGRGDDAVQRYVATLAELEQITPPGKYWSYNNAGFTTLGRIIEVLTGQTWDDALRSKLLEPAGLEQSVTLAEDALLFRTAVGHLPDPSGSTVPVKSWGMGRSAGPAGGICSTASDVVRFAQCHIDGTKIISPETSALMRTVQIDMNGGDEDGADCGLAWMLSTHEGLGLAGHNGGTVGQASFFTSVPERGFALSILMNGPTAAVVGPEIAGYVFQEVLGVPAPAPRTPGLPSDPPDVDLSNYEGRYERRSVHTTIFRGEDGGLMAGMEYVNIPYELTPPPPMPVRAIDASTFVAMAGDQVAMAIRFFDFDEEGRPGLLFAGRMGRRRD